MKIALVCGHYLPELGYLEVHLARAWAEAGNEVRVITTAAVPSYVRERAKEQPGLGLTADGPVEVVRLKPVFSLGQLVWARGVKKALAAYNPDMVVVIGLGKVFPAPVFKEKQFPIAVLLGDNSHTYLQRTLRHRLIQRWIKKPVYEKGIRAAKQIFSYTPETLDVLSSWLSDDTTRLLRQKNIPLSLGFNHHTFFYSEDLRNTMRRNLRLAEDEFLLLSVVRMGPNKDFTPLIETVEELLRQGVKLRCLLVGVGEDEHSRRLQKRLEQSADSAAFETRPFIAHRELNAYYNAADIGYWPITAISVFEGLGTGLQLMLPGDASLKHLEALPDNVVFIGDSMGGALIAATEKCQSITRAERAQKAVEKFAYRSLAQHIVESMQRG